MFLIPEFTLTAGLRGRDRRARAPGAPSPLLRPSEVNQGGRGSPGLGFGGGTQAVAPSPAPPEPLPRAVPAFPCLPAHANTLVLALPALFSPVPEPSTAEIRPHEAPAGNRVEFVAPWIRLYPFLFFFFF